MCGRTSLFRSIAELADRFDAEPARSFEPRYNIAPGDDLAVVTNDAPGTIDAFQWGLVPHWVDDLRGWPRPINARAESIAEKPSFRDAFDRRRCLVLADGFYEWSGNGGGKHPYRVTLGENEPFAMAGLWERWEGNGSGNGAELTTVTVVTTAANDLLAPIHDRMPVVFTPDEERAWLRADDADARRTMLDPYDGPDMRVYPVSTAVNDPSHDGPELLEPVADAGRQRGLDEFGA